MTAAGSSQAADGRFVGRVDLLARLDERLRAGARLVTLVGPPGMGKTTLAKRYLELHGGYWRADDGGAWFCDLSESHDAAQAAAAVAGTLAAQREHLGAALDGLGPALIVLDNFEQLADVIDDTVGRWLEAAPDMQFVVTSRQRLQLPIEVVLELPPLQLQLTDADDASSEAAQLWVARVRQQRPDYRLEGDERAMVLQILEQLDGIPLAIELAAARMPLMGAAGLLARMRDQIDVLRHKGAGRPPRHGTLSAALDGSWELLTDVERRVFAQCSLFRGGFGIDAAERVLDAARALDVLESLHDKSLVKSDDVDEMVGHRRLSLYLAIRAYAARQLEQSGEVETAFRRHAAYYLTHAERLAEEVDGPDGARALALLSLERDNIVAAAQRCLEQGSAAVSDALRLLTALAPLALFHGSPGIVELDTAIGAARGSDSVEPQVLARALELRGRVRAWLGQLEQGLSETREAAELARRASDAAAEARALYTHSRIEFQLGRPKEGRATAERALERARACGDALLMGMALESLSVLHAYTGDHARANELAHQALARYDEAHSAHHRANLLGKTLAGRNVHPLALDAVRDYVERGLALIPSGSADAATYVATRGIAEHLGGELAASEASFDEALAIARRLGSPVWQGRLSGYIAANWLECGRLTESRARFEHSLRLLEQHGAKREAAFVRLMLYLIESVNGSDTARIEALARALDAWDEAHLARVRGDAERCAALRLEGTEQYVSAGAPPLEPNLQIMPSDVATARRTLAGLLGKVAAGDVSDGAPATRVAAAGQWFQVPSGERISCRRRKPMGGIVLALARAHLDSPGAALDVDALLRAGWGEERMKRSAALNRLHVTLSRMRELGLRDLLQTNDDGWLFDPEAAVQLLD